MSEETVDAPAGVPVQDLPLYGPPDYLHETAIGAPEAPIIVPEA